MSTAVALDAKKYARLLKGTLPAPIKTHAEYERMLAQVELLMRKGDAALSREQQALLELLAILIEQYEERHYPIATAGPHDVLRHLMDANGLTQKDLWPLFGSKGIASEVINGKRAISKTQAKKLAAFFHVSPALFL
jgi:HTH-type transcriptional regulator/antitoxin HigA